MREKDERDKGLPSVPPSTFPVDGQVCDFTDHNIKVCRIRQLLVARFARPPIIDDCRIASVHRVERSFGSVRTSTFARGNVANPTRPNSRGIHFHRLAGCAAPYYKPGLSRDFRFVTCSGGGGGGIRCRCRWKVCRSGVQIYFQPILSQGTTCVSHAIEERACDVQCACVCVCVGARACAMCVCDVALRVRNTKRPRVCVSMQCSVESKR